MKIVHVEDFFHPDTGYQLNILSKYLVKFGDDVTIITGELKKTPKELTSFFGRENIAQRDAEFQTKYGVKIIRLPLKAFVSGRAIFKKGLLKKIKEIHPDILFIHGNDTFTGMWALKNRKKFGCPMVMDNHMLEMASRNRLSKLFRKFYRMFFTPIIVKDKITVIRTQDDNYVEKCLGIPLSLSPWISYGADTLLFHPNEVEKKRFREENQLSEKAFIITYAGKIDEAKGGKFLAESIKKKIIANREIVFVIVGNTVGEYGKEVEDLFTTSENKIYRYPTQKYVNLAYYFQIADLAVFPKQCSLSFYDVQACGVPVLSENNNINMDRCSHQNGWNFEPNDIKGFRRKIIEIANLPEEEYQKYSDNACHFVVDNYDYEQKAREYEAVFLKIYMQDLGGE